MIEENWIEPYVPLSGKGFIDVGANLCTWTKWLAPGYKFVHVVEPYKEAIDAAGQLPDNVTVHLFGAWSKEADIHFGTYSPTKLLFAQEDIKSYFADIGINNPINENSLILPCKTLDSLIPEKSDISFLKIDVEGAELQVLEGAREIIKNSHPFMIVEIHSKHNCLPIEEILREERYSIQVVRNPYHGLGSDHWGNHFWFICK
jgi:FkbM family methyltransferase